MNILLFFIIHILLAKKLKEGDFYCLSDKDCFDKMDEA